MSKICQRSPFVWRSLPISSDREGCRNGAACLPLFAERDRLLGQQPQGSVRPKPAGGFPKRMVAADATMKSIRERNKIPVRRSAELPGLISLGEMQNPLAERDEYDGETKSCRSPK